MNKNPFPPHSDRWEIWNMLVDRDIKAFIAGDWGMVRDDFIEDCFMGIDAASSSNPDAWTLSYPLLEDYKQEWLRQAEMYNATEWAEDSELALFKVTTLRDIEINGDAALVHKKFFGSFKKKDGELVPTDWQTIYRCRKKDGKWKIAGFTGYMPHWPGHAPAQRNSGITAPKGSKQHRTAGPYSPVLEIVPGTLVVISGQAALDEEGKVVGKTIEEQTIHTLDNCKRQLESAGSSLKEVFKVNVFLADLDDWPRFNSVYQTYFKTPLPVRTAVGCDLLMSLLVEVEMWALRP